MYLLSIDKCCIPLSQACAGKSTTSLPMIGCIPGLLDCRSQQRFRIRGVTVFPRMEGSIINTNVQFL